MNNPSLRSYEPEVERLMDEAALKPGFPPIAASRMSNGFSPERCPASRRKNKGARSPHLRGDLLLSEISHAHAGHGERLAFSHSCGISDSCAFATMLARRAGKRLPRAHHPHALASHRRIWKERRSRRRSRVELWNTLSLLTHGFSNPQIEGFTVHVVATTPAAAGTGSAMRH